MSTAPYAYEHVSREILSEDMAFRDGAPAAGDRLPEIDLPTTDGGRFRTADLAGRRPLLLVIGSYTCPMTASSNPLLKRLWTEFGSEVEFVTLYVREAHPGERRDQAATAAEKLERARALKARDRRSHGRSPSTTRPARHTAGWTRSRTRRT